MAVERSAGSLVRGSEQTTNKNLSYSRTIMAQDLVQPECHAMIDKSREPRANRPRRTLPAFTPIPRLCARHDGWTPERQRGFIEALADTGSSQIASTGGAISAK
jgi:hypothetical protein